MIKQFIYPLAAFVLLIFPACHNTREESPQSDSAIRAEVQQTMDKEFQFSSEANLDSALKYFDTSSDFYAMDDGIMLNYDQFKQLAKETFDSMKKQTFRMKSEEIKVYDHDLVNCLYSSSDDITLKNDSLIHLSNFAGSFLLRKIHDQWKIVFLHQSVPSTPEEAQVH